jgi:PAS domain S-box-containing protein
VLDAMPVGSGVLEAGRWVLVNPAWARLLWVARPEDLLGRALAEWVVPEDAAVLSALLGGVVAGDPQHPCSREVTVAGPSGARRRLDLTAARLVAQGGATTVLVAGRDVTERVELQRQVVIADRMATVGFLAAGLAHELNNPVLAVTANLELAIEDVERLATRIPPAVAADLREGIESAVRAAKRIQQIIGDLRGLAEAGDSALAPVDVTAVLESVLRITAADMRRRARLVLSLDPIPRVTAEPTRLAQVFLNLVVNAIQALPEPRADHVIEVGAKLAGEEVVVSVRDDGPGMTPEVQARLFTPFFTTKPPGEGTGLGLSLCRRIVEGFGGRMTVQTALGHGSTFRVHLSALQDARTAAP